MREVKLLDQLREHFEKIIDLFEAAAQEDKECASKLIGDIHQLIKNGGYDESNAITALCAIAVMYFKATNCSKKAAIRYISSLFDMNDSEEVDQEDEDE